MTFHTLETDQDGLLFLDSEKTYAHLVNKIASGKPDIIATDPLRDVSLGDLNKDVDMSATLRALTVLCRRGNRDRGIVTLHHALTGRAGAAKAVGFERAGFGRNSKVLHGWARGQINIAPGKSDDPGCLVMACGKNSNGKEFPTFAVRLDAETMVYEPDPTFEVEEWKQEIAGNEKTGRKASIEDVVAVLSKRDEMEKAALVKAVMALTGCGKTRAYNVVDEAEKRKRVHFSKVRDVYELPARK